MTGDDIVGIILATCFGLFFVAIGLAIVITVWRD